VLVNDDHTRVWLLRLRLRLLRMYHRGPNVHKQAQHNDAIAEIRKRVALELVGVQRRPVQQLLATERNIIRLLLLPPLLHHDGDLIRFSPVFCVELCRVCQKAGWLFITLL
jgi:hypothetical protein